mmetsp:Transcript_13685/g.18970  ORF Transcript_13685/g.18970 Transcript_13685/m.18970 type:complete len:153 (-) Transcript_13685:392-850(-)
MELFLGLFAAGKIERTPATEHFLPQTSQCRIYDGMVYDYHLKVEEMNLWYQDIVKYMKLESVVSTGWEKFSGQSCFYKINGKTCEQMISEPLPAEANIDTHDVHTTHAGNYSTDISQFVGIFQKLYSEDYEYFNYSKEESTVGLKHLLGMNK